MLDTSPRSASAVAGDLTSRPPRIRRHWSLIASSTVLSVFVLGAIVGPFLTHYSANDTHLGSRLRAPFSHLPDGHFSLLGTDSVGRDLFAEVMQGARVSLTVAVVTLVVAGIVGVLLGTLSGYFGGIIDTVIMRIADIQLAFPSILLAIFIAGVIGPSATNVIISLAVTRWVVFARVARGAALSVKEREFVQAARTLGARQWHILRRCIFPAVVSPTVAVASVQLSSVVVAEASLSFLGLGTTQDNPSWGLTISNGQDYLATAWWIAIIPAAVLAILVVTFGVFSDQLQARR